MNGKIANPLKNHPIHAGQAYQEVTKYGPSGLAGAGAGLPSTSVCWQVTDPQYRAVQAVWDGSLYIQQVENPLAPESERLVTLALERHLLSKFLCSLPVTADEAVATQGAAMPRYAFYRHIAYASLPPALTALGVPESEIHRFLAHEDGDPTKPWYRVAVSVGDAIGELGAATPALEFQLSLLPTGVGAVYPEFIYRLIHEEAPALFAVGDEYDQQRSIWAVCSKRIIVWLRDEWNHPMGQYERCRVRITPSGGASLTADVTAWTDPDGFAFAPGSSGSLELKVEAVTPDADQTPLLLSPVPGSEMSQLSLVQEIRAPAELVVQAINPLSWFPEQGGKRVGNNGAVQDVMLPAPHAPGRFTNGNKITPLVDGPEFYADLAQELGQMTGSGNFLCHANWWCDAEVPVVRQTATTAEKTLGEYWKQLHQQGVPIFALFWHPVGAAYGPLAGALPAGPLQDTLGDIAATGLQATLNRTGVPFLSNDKAADVLQQCGEVILDARHRPGASHHQKITVLKNSRLAGYVGGMDIRSDRLNSTRHWDYAKGQAPFHDVHCKVEGPAAWDILRTFISRWNDHPFPATPYNFKTQDMQCTDLNFNGAGHVLSPGAAAAAPDGTNLAQIARTYGNCKGMQGIAIQNGGTFATGDGYSFAPDGDFTIESAILGAIKRAKKYIYIEDQYLANLKIATAVADKIGERKAAIAQNPDREEPFHVYMVIPYFDDVTMNLSNYKRQVRDGGFQSIVDPITLLVTAMSGAVPDQIQAESSWAYTVSRWWSILSMVDPDEKYWSLHCLALPPYEQHPAAERRIYVHTKSVVVDDVWATIGSANMAVRSYTCDSEINVNFIDGQVDGLGRRVSVRDYRVKLWAEHLGRGAHTLVDLPANSPEAVALWRNAQDPLTKGDPKAKKPLGSRVYAWPRATLYKAQNYIPSVRFRTQNGDPHFLPMAGGSIHEVPMYWWLVEEYGKLPWSASAASLRPPAIGSRAFAFDGETGAAYASKDLYHGP